MLAADQAELARRFSTKDPHPQKWEGVGWTERAGTPMIDGALIWLACELREVPPGRRSRDRDRGRWSSWRPSDDGEPLLFHEGEYQGLDGAGCERRPEALTRPSSRLASANRKMTSAETAMIPVSRRTIANAIPRWRSVGSDSKSRPTSSRSAAPARTASASSETHDGQQAVEVVKAARGLVAREQQDRPERGLENDRDLGHAQRVPEPDAGLAAKPRDPAPAAGDQVGGDHRDPDHEMDRDHRSAPRPEQRAGGPASPPKVGRRATEIRLLMRKITM